jgi:16S rRNA (uracil1498-N3)-methyltransferase
MSCRLFVARDRLTEGDFALDADDHHYLIRVRRLRAGDTVTLFDGEGREADAEITAVTDGGASLRVGAPRDVREPDAVHLTVLLSVIKGDRTEWAIQKLVELGVDRIVPVLAARCVVKLEGKRAADRHRRYQAVAEDACRQCGRATIPEVDPPRSLAEALARAPERAVKLMLWERARGASLRAALPAQPPEAVALLVGPEGGFTDAEAELAASEGWRPVGFGPRILRSETAAVAAAAAVAASVGNLD